jgi:hypothetical protein
MEALAQFIEMARKRQCQLNLMSVAQLNEKLAVDRSGLVMAALEQRARFEDDARTQTDDEWTRGYLIASAEWALPWPGEK